MSYIEFIAGCNGGLFGVLVGHPFDTVKVKLQLTGQSASAMFKNESMRTLYRGVSSPLLFLTSINAIVFGTHANLKRLFTEEQQKGLWCEFTCGFMVGATQSIIASPMELLKSRLQATSLQPNSDQKVNLMRDIAKLRKDYPHQNIIRSLYRGYSTTFWRDSPAFAIYFSTYEYFLRYMNPNDRKDEPSNFVVLGSGGIAGVLSWFLTYPIDVIKTQIQLNPGLTVRNFLRQTYRDVGLQGLARCLSRGLTIACIRAAYCNAVTFYFYHLTVKWMIQRNYAN